MDNNFLKTVSEYTGLDIGDIGPDVLLAHYCYDLDLAEMAFWLESDYGIEIPNEMLEGPLTVGELWDYIEGAK